MAKKTVEHTPYLSLHQIADRFPPVDWLWPSWIPRGMLTLLGGAPGVGKSLVALDLARRIIHNDPFPDGAPCPVFDILTPNAWMGTHRGSLELVV